MRRVRAVVWKDLLDLSKNRGLLWSLAALPLVIVTVPIGIVASYARNPNEPSLRTMVAYYDAMAAGGASPARFLIDKVLSDWFAIYLMLPIFVPILISAHAIAGEKEARTLEPLLTSPVTALELVIGKSLASLIPATAICLFAFVVLCVGVDVAAWPLVGELVLPDTTWLLGVLFVAPLFAFFGNGVAVLLSARVGDARLAQQLAGLFVLPIVGLAASQFVGWLKSGTVYYLLVGAVVLVLDVAIVVLARRLFDRERLLTKWG